MIHDPTHPSRWSQSQLEAALLQFEDVLAGLERVGIGTWTGYLAHALQDRAAALRIRQSECRVETEKGRADFYEAKGELRAIAGFAALFALQSELADSIRQREVERAPVSA